jgi:uncharacterized membrane protein
MIVNNEHTQLGIASIILAVLGMIFYFIGWFFFSFVDNRLYGMVIGLTLSILAIVLGYIAKKQGDSYGTYGIILGSFIIIITIIITILTTPTSVEIGYY